MTSNVDFKKVLVLFVILFSLFNVKCEQQQKEGFNFAVLSDLHIGESQVADDTTLLAIKAVNSIVESHNISFVIITGDITSSALPSQYELARKMLDTLSIPYYPIFGNHDVWVYVRPTNETSWEEKEPTGDALFRYYFEDIFIRDNITYNFNTVWNPEQKINSTFLNWEMRFPSESGTFVLFGLDFVTREAATNPKDLYKGGAPTASLHNFPNGTLFWLKERLNLLPHDTVSVVTAHHHTVVTTPFFTPDYFSMNENDRDDLKDALLSNGREIDLFWGALVGHMHFWDDQKALFSNYRQWETTAAKSDGENAVAVVNVRNGTIKNINRCCGGAELVDNLQLVRKTVASAFFFIFALSILKVAYSFTGFLSFIFKFLSFVVLVVSQVYPLIGGNAIVTKHINANYVGPIIISIIFIYGIVRNKFTRNVIFGNLLLIVGTALMDVVRYPIRTSWLYDGENYNVFWVFITFIFILIVQLVKVNNQNQRKWTYPLILSFIVGILIELIGASISSLLYRMLSPITLSFYDNLEHITILSLAVIFIAQQVVLSSIAKKCDILYCTSIISATQTVCNALSQLVLRSSSYPICFSLSMAFVSLIPLSLGVILLTKDIEGRNYNIIDNNNNINEETEMENGRVGQIN